MAPGPGATGEGAVAQTAWFPVHWQGKRTLANRARSLWTPAKASCGCSGAISAQEAKAGLGIRGHGQELGAGDPAWLWVRRGRALPSIARHLDHRPWRVAVQTHV